MTDTVDDPDPTPCVRAEREGELGCNPQLLVELLNDDDARVIYLFLEEPATVGDVSDELDLPQSTAYRKVENLHEAGLLSQLNEHDRTGVPSYYVQAIDHVTVTYGDPLRIECVRNGVTLYCEQ